MNALTKSSTAAPLALGNSLIPQNMDQAIKFAEMMARGKMMPQHLQGSPGDCLMVVEQAMRWQMSPFAVAQCTASIKGKLLFEGKLVAAAIEASGAIVGLFDYQFSGSGNGRKIVVSATRNGETEPKTIELALSDAATDNGMWKKQPDQQLVYAGTRVWGRRWTPGVMLGVYSREEFSATGEPFDGTTIDARAEPEPQPEAKPRPTISGWLDALALRLAAADTIEAVNAIVAEPEVVAAFDKLHNGALERLRDITDQALARVSEPGDGDGGMEV